MVKLGPCRKWFLNGYHFTGKRHLHMEDKKLLISYNMYRKR